MADGAPPGDDDLFGTPAQRALLARGRALFAVTGHDPRYTYYGRTVGLTGPQDGSVETLAALTALQGNSNVALLPDADLPRWRAALVARGLAPVHYARWSGGDGAMAAAGALLAAHALPADLTPVWVGPETDDATLARLAKLALACGVLPPAGAVLRCAARPGLAVLAVDGRGRAVSCAAAAAYLHADHPQGRQCWWGMLATAPERRGARLALILGAMAMLAARDLLGFETVFTGVEPGNMASEGVCARLGLTREAFSVLGAADPGLLPGGRMTK